MKKFFLIFTLIFFSTVLFSQQSFVKGTVKDLKTKDIYMFVRADVEPFKFSKLLTKLYE